MLPKGRVEEQIELSLLQATVLLFHLHKGAHYPESVGFEDIDRTLEQLSQQLMQKNVMVPKSVLESALWSCNLMSELDAFWHPLKLNFDTFLVTILGNYPGVFDKTYNYIKSVKGVDNVRSNR